MRRFLSVLKYSKHAAVRLLCIPYAGGNAAFVRTWSQRLPPHIELMSVQYLGAAANSPTPTVPSVQSIAANLLEEVAQLADLPLIVFGYSLGSLVGYELCLALQQRGIHAPAELVAAAAKAPHLPRPQAPMAGLPDAQFIAKLRELGGTPEEVLQNTELLELFLPMLRRDFATAETYQPSPAAALTCPITAIGGSADASVNDAAIAAWSMHTLARFKQHRLEGGHFFMHEQPHALITIVREVAERYVAQAAG